MEMMIAAVATDAGPTIFRPAQMRAQTVGSGDAVGSGGVGMATGGEAGSGMLITR